jgi:hypothetical protein
LNRALCAIKGTESQTGVDPALDRAVILLDHVIEIGHDSTAASSTKHEADKAARRLGHGTSMSFDITPDGRQIVFDRVREKSDIVLIDRPY